MELLYIQGDNKCKICVFCPPACCSFWAQGGRKIDYFYFMLNKLRNFNNCVESYFFNIQIFLLFISHITWDIKWCKETKYLNPYLFFINQKSSINFNLKSTIGRFYCGVYRQKVTSALPLCRHGARVSGETEAGEGGHLASARHTFMHATRKRRVVTVQIAWHATRCCVMCWYSQGGRPSLWQNAMHQLCKATSDVRQNNRQQMIPEDEEESFSRTSSDVKNRI